MKDKVQNIPLHCPPLIRRNASIADSLQLLTWFDAEFAVVCDFSSDDLMGWISRRTLQKTVDHFSAACESIRVDRIMAPYVNVCYAHHPIEAARSLADHRQAQFLAVFDIHETFRGILYTRDLHQHAAERIGALLRPHTMSHVTSRMHELPSHHVSTTSTACTRWHRASRRAPIPPE